MLSLLRELRSPLVTTLHTIPLKPTSTQRRILTEIADRSDRLVVMSKKGLGFLQDIYDVSGDRIDFIPHGIHDVPLGVSIIGCSPCQSMTMGCFQRPSGGQWVSVVILDFRSIRNASAVGCTSGIQA
ncbi:MAG: glycosyltransferase [Pirellulaceae bacterium]